MRAIAAEVINLPFVEPEPFPSDPQSDFREWLNDIASMSALILRFYHRCEPSDFETWIETLDGVAEDLEEQAASNEANGEDKLAVIMLVHALVALARGVSVEEVATSIQPPFDAFIKQTMQLAEEPVWLQPGSSPLDYLIEQVAQKAVRVLRRHDESRNHRLKNLALRYQLMEIDLREQEPLIPVANFLHALHAMVLLESKQLPQLEQPLEKPFDTILIAVFEAGQEVVVEPME